MRIHSPLMYRRFLPALALLVPLAMNGCELFAYADRDRIPASHGGGGAGGTGGTGGTSSSSSSSSTSSSGIACLLPIDCPGTDTDCTVRTCVANQCGSAFVAAETPTANQAAGDCKRAVCDGKGVEMLVGDDSDVPTDGNPCTEDVCTGGVPSNPPSSSSTPCNFSGGSYCDGSKHCVECVIQSHCASDFTCINNICVTCLDGKKDGTETDVDCGGPRCPACADGKHCAISTDCKSGVCSGTFKSCQAAFCNDQVQNGTETDVDCGGAGCTACPSGKGCLQDKDCLSNTCFANACL